MKLALIYYISYGNTKISILNTALCINIGNWYFRGSWDITDSGLIWLKWQKYKLFNDNNSYHFLHTYEYVRYYSKHLTCIISFDLYDTLWNRACYSHSMYFKLGLKVRSHIFFKTAHCITKQMALEDTCKSKYAETWSRILRSGPALVH